MPPLPRPAIIPGGIAPRPLGPPIIPRPLGEGPPSPPRPAGAVFAALLLRYSSLHTVSTASAADFSSFLTDTNLGPYINNIKSKTLHFKMLN